MDCPDRHTEYASRMLAENSATLHAWQNPDCGGFAAFPCEGHWHVGHPDRSTGAACRRDNGTAPA